MNTIPQQPVLRKTTGLCSACLRAVPAEVREEDGAIRLVKICREHGETRALLSEHPSDFREIHDFFFDVMDRPLPQRDFILRLTERCNLNCPICLAGANQDILPDMTPADIRRLVSSCRGRKFDLMGCEPTVMQDLPEIIGILRETRNIAALHSNGLELADRAYLQTLKKAGLDEVHLQFDGFDDRAYEVIRGRPLLDTKLKAMDNLSALAVPVDLVMTVLAGVNEQEMLRVLEFGLKRENVKEIFFLGCRMLGKAAAGGRFESAQLMPDQVIDLLDRATGGRIARANVRRFQKLYYTFLSVFGVRKCMYVQHYLVFRDARRGYITVDEVLDMPRLDRALERFRKRRRKWRKASVLLLALESMPVFLAPRCLRYAADLAAMNLMMALGFNLRRARSKGVMLGYITACDPLIYDAAVAEQCGKGEVSRDLGFQEAGALANVMREHRWRRP